MKRIAISLLLLLSGVLCFGQYDKDVFNFRGRRALSEGKYADAIQQFNILARLDTTDYWTFFFRGIAKYNLVPGHYQQPFRQVRRGLCGF